MKNTINYIKYGLAVTGAAISTLLGDGICRYAYLLSLSRWTM